MFYVIYIWHTGTLGDIKCAKDFSTRKAASDWFATCSNEFGVTPICIATSKEV